MGTHPHVVVVATRGQEEFRWDEKAVLPYQETVDFLAVLG